MRPMSCLLSACLLMVLAPGAPADDKPANYLQDGKLAHTLEIRDVQGGFAGFTGRLWTVEPSGRWTLSRVMNQKAEVEKKGELTKEELATLAKELARHDLARLTSKAPGRPMANPHVVSIKFGKLDVSLTLGAGVPLPKPDPENPKATIEGRYAGIANAVQQAVKGKKE